MNLKEATEIQGMIPDMKEGTKVNTMIEETRDPNITTERDLTRDIAPIAMIPTKGDQGQGHPIEKIGTINDTMKILGGILILIEKGNREIEVIKE